MFLKKVCIFLLCALCVVDILFLSIYLKTKESMTKLSDSMIENAVTYYNSCGIEIGTETVNKKIPNNAIYTFSQSNADCAGVVVQKISQKYGNSNIEISYIETPDGYSYTASDKKGVSSNLRIYKDSFNFEYSANNFSKQQLTWLSEEPFVNDTTQITETLSQTVKQFVECLSLINGVSYSVTGALKRGEYTYVSLTQNVGGCAVNDMYVNVLFDGKQIVYSTGNYIFSDMKRSYKQELVDGVNALKGIDVNNTSEIVSERIVYMYRYGDAGLSYLIPVWKIEYIDIEGTLKTQYVDAIKS